MTKRHQKTDLFFLLALIFSGAAALGYELLWTRLLALSLGGEVLGILGVLAGFFGGMVLGAFVLSKHASRVKSPVWMFVKLELCAALYGLISPWLIYGLSDFLPQWLGPVAGDNNSFLALMVTVLVAGLALLPATFCIGANFAYLVEARRRVFQKDSIDKNLGRVYAANTFGATLGVFSAVYLVMPKFGLAWSGAFFALLGIIAVGLAYYWQKLMDHSGILAPKKVRKSRKQKIELKWVLILLFGTGLASIGLEIVVVHLLKQILQNTIFTFGNILAIYLLGTTMGAWIYQSLAKNSVYKRTTFLFSGMLFSLLLLIAILWNADGLLEALSASHSAYINHLLAEILLAFLLFIFPTLFMGAIFSHLMSWVSPQFVGKAYAINTLGSMLSPFIFGLLIIPLMGSYIGILLVVIIYSILFVLLAFKLDWPKLWLSSPILTLVLVIVLGGSGLDLIVIKKEAQVLERKEGLMGTVLVLEEPRREGPFGLPLRTLQVNNHFRMGGGASFLERRMGSLPLLLADQSEEVLFLGIGTGTTLGVIKDYPVKTVQAVEIVPEIIDLLPRFNEHNQDILSDNRVTFHAADARRFMAASSQEYDLIVADLFHPARDGAGLLYTKEHFEHLRQHLKEGGKVVQWLPMHQFDLKSLKIVIRTFQSVFPDVHAILGAYNAQYPVIALIGSHQKWTLDPEVIDQVIASTANIKLVFENVQDLLGSYVAGPETLSNFVGKGNLNTDLNPIILFEAPKSIYTSELDRAQTNIGTLMAIREPFPVSLVENMGHNQSLITQIQKNWQAVGHFIEGNRLLVSNKGQQAWQKYVEAYVANPDFSPARGKLFQAVLEGGVAKASLNGLLIPRDMARLELLLGER